MSRGQAFVDETTQGDYLVVCSVVPSSSVNEARKAMRQLLRPNQRSIHMKDEGPSTRRKILRVINDLQPAVHIYRSRPADHGGHVQARAACLSKLAQDAVTQHLERLVLDAIESMVTRDRAALIRGADLAGARPMPFEYYHRKRNEEPLLWIPDAVGWLYARGGQERTSVQHLITLKNV